MWRHPVCLSGRQANRVFTGSILWRRQPPHPGKCTCWNAAPQLVACDMSMGAVHPNSEPLAHDSRQVMSHIQFMLNVWQKEAPHILFCVSGIPRCFGPAPRRVGLGRRTQNAWHLSNQPVCRFGSFGGSTRNGRRYICRTRPIAAVSSRCSQILSPFTILTQSTQLLQLSLYFPSRHPVHLKNGERASNDLSAWLCAAQL